jgi:hypothetical protein
MGKKDSSRKTAEGKSVRIWGEMSGELKVGDKE